MRSYKTPVLNFRIYRSSGQPLRHLPSNRAALEGTLVPISPDDIPISPANEDDVPISPADESKAFPLAKYLVSVVHEDDVPISPSDELKAFPGDESNAFPADESKAFPDLSSHFLVSLPTAPLSKDS